MQDGDLSQRKKRVVRMIRVLKKLFPDAHIALRYSNPWELLVAVMLSAQCTDKKVNEVTEKLFKKYQAIKNYTSAKQSDFQKDIYSTGFYKNKAKHILAAAKMIEKTYHGKIPDTMEELLKIPGVGRKTANVMLGAAFGKSEGIAVDTHLIRLSKKLGLTHATNPAIIERDLMRIVPRKEWITFSHMLIHYGRTYCPAKRHDHMHCPLSHT
ncbi:endonuclease III [Candidatus Uhrbacteria bacterium]|nr:endonuclease III [Candidatus Uhrbacteria bacterium]